MAKKSKKSIYKCGGKLEEGGMVPNPYLQLGTMAGNTFGDILESQNSALGTIGGGTLKGAAAGTAILPGVGTLVGGALGTIGGIFKNKQNKEMQEAQERLEMQKANMQAAQASLSANKMYAEGGSLNQNTNITEYNGLPHELGGLQLGQNTEVEDNETRGTMNTKDYIFSDSLRPDKKSKKTFADISKDIEKRFKNYENDKFAIKAKDIELSKLMYEQEALKQNKFEEEAKKLMMQYPEQMGMREQPIDEELMNSVEMREGGKIFIKPSKKGTFTRAAKERGLGVQEFASKVLANKSNYSPAMIKKANFVKNTASWNQYGGFVGQENILSCGGKIKYDGGGVVNESLDNLLKLNNQYQNTMNTDFSNLNVQNNLSQGNLNANAYTQGNNTAFYNPTLDKSNLILQSNPLNNLVVNNNTRGLTDGEPDKTYTIAGKTYNINEGTHNVLANRDKRDLWTKSYLPNATQIEDINKQVFGIDTGLSNYQWHDRTGLNRIKQDFKPEDMEDFKAYYKLMTSNEYPESYENVIKNAVDKPLNEWQDPTRFNWGATDLATLPLLESFMRLKGYTPPTEKDKVITGEPLSNQKETKTGNPLVNSGTPSEIPSLPGNIPINDLGLTKVPFGWNGNGDPRKFQSVGSNPLKPFGPDWLGAGLSMLPNIGMGIGNLSLANKLKFDRTNAEIYNPDYVDPTRAIQETRNQYAGAKDIIRQNAGSSGNYMSNILGATSSQSEVESGIQSKYDEANAGIYNQAASFNAQQKQRANEINAQIQQNEMLQKTQLKQQGYENLADALHIGIGTFYQSKRDADKMNIAGGENFYYRRIGSLANQKPVKVFKGNGYHYYEDPNTGETKFLDPNSGKIIKSKSQIDKFLEDLNSKRNTNYSSKNDRLEELKKEFEFDKMTQEEQTRFLKQHSTI